MPEFDENDIRVRYRNTQSIPVKIGAVYKCGMGEGNYYSPLRIDNDLVQMICIEAGWTDREYYRHAMF